MTTSVFLTVTVILALIFSFLGAKLILWTALAAACLYYFGASQVAWIVFGAIALIFNLPPIRRILFSLPIMKTIQKLGLLPKVSETEKIALEAGTIWAEGEFFKGRPDFNKLLKEDYPTLNQEEQSFVDEKVSKVCEMCNDWAVTQNRDLSPEVWNYLKKEKFFGMIIPKKYGGLGFSAMGHSEVIQKLASRSTPLAVTTMVPNSLGPAELLLHYGTEKQKDYYLPRLASGEEIPCFALTEPKAGSDAGSLTSNGTVFKGEDGKLYMRLNWNKRWITLASISTIIGMAFRLYDPEGLLGGEEDLGITCALIPSDTKGVVIGDRHDPLDTPFYNCPTHGKDVVVSVDTIIGGPERAGDGWQMLMESLAAGRGISIPAQSVGGIKKIARAVSAHAVVRKQFGISIGRFEGVAAPMAHIAGFAYILEAARRFTCGALDSGSKPPVITAIAKYNFSEMGRVALNHGMDIMGGAAISEGPKNLLASTYKALPIAITVEGANILTRTLIVFGQGLIRAHPHVHDEMEAIEKNDLKSFDKAFTSHIKHVFTCASRTKLLSFTRGYIAKGYGHRSVRRYYQKLSWASANFALMADVAMVSLGGSLKFKEQITGRFADILSWCYFGTAVLRRFEADGNRKEDLPYVHWSMNYAFFQMQLAFDGIYSNLPVPGLTWLFRGPIRWWSRFNSLGTAPLDKHNLKISELIQTYGKQRERICEGGYLPTDINTEQLALLEEALKAQFESSALIKKMKKEMGRLTKKRVKRINGAIIKEAISLEVLSQEEANTISRAQELADLAIQVDSFTQKEYLGSKKAAIYEAYPVKASQAPSGGSSNNNEAQAS